MHDANILPYGDDDARNALVDASAAAEHAGDVDRFLRYMLDLDRMGHTYGDTPSWRAGHGDDWATSGLPMPAGLIAARAIYRAEALIALDVHNPNTGMKAA